MIRHPWSLVALAAILCLAIAGLAQTPIPAPGTITTIAGSGVAGVPGSGALALSAQIGVVTGVALDPAGNVYFADSSNNQVFEIRANSGMISLIAGNGAGATFGSGGSLGDGHPAIDAVVNAPWGLAIDTTGNLYVSDPQNNVVRKIDMSTGLITTVAGYSGSTVTGNPNLAVNTRLSQPSGISLDADGNLYIAEAKGNIIHKVDKATGLISTVAGNGTHGYHGDGASATSAQLNAPTAVAFDGAGNLYIADYGNDAVRRVAASSGVITTVAGTGVAEYVGDGGPAASAHLQWPEFLAVDTTGNIYIGDYAHGVVRQVRAATGNISTIAGNGEPGYGGDGGPATDAQMLKPFGLAAGSNGNLYIADSGNFRLRVVGSGAASAATPFVTVTSSDPNPTMNETVTLTAHIVNGGGASIGTGEIAWYDGGILVGQTAVDSTGAASTLTPLSQAGTHLIAAGYVGSGSNTGTLSLPVSGFALSSNTTSVSSPSGQADTFLLNLNAFYGFTGTVDLSCSGMPSPGTCSLSKSSITLTNGSITAPVSLTVTTTSTTSASAKARPGGSTALVLACLCPLFLAGFRRGRRSLLAIPLVFCALVVVAGLSGCGGKATPTSGTTTPVVTRVPPGTYTVTVTATSGANTVQLPLTIIVNS